MAPQVAEQASQSEQLQLQIGQLATQMRDRQGDLDRREAHLNARIAQIDQDVRSTRLWIEEQESLCAKRQEELIAKEKELADRLERLAAADAILQHKTQELIEIEETLAQREAAIDLRAQLIAQRAAEHEQDVRDFEAQRQQAQQELDAQRDASLAEIERRRAALQADLERVHHDPIPTGSQNVEEELQHAEETIRARWQEIELAQTRLTAAQEETKAFHESLLAKQRQQEEDLHAERLQLALERRRLMDEIERKREAIERRSEHLDKNQSSLAQMRAELAQIHQETLETRLATEELWAQMAGDSPAAALVESLARTRAKLAEHYRAVQEEIQQKKNELLAIRAEMTQEHRRLVKRKHHFDQWAQRCQQENEEMARRLAAKEKELNRREAQMADEVHAWEIERIEYQQALRQLMSRLPEPEGAAV